VGKSGNSYKEFGVKHGRETHVCTIEKMNNKLKKQNP
jgi:hypothetical protein